MGIYLPALIFLLIAKLAVGFSGVEANSQKRQFGVLAVDTMTIAAFTFFFALSQPQTSTSAAFLILSLTLVGMARLAQQATGATQRHFTGHTETVLFVIACCLYPAGFAAIAALFGILWVVGGGVRELYRRQKNIISRKDRPSGAVSDIVLFNAICGSGLALNRFPIAAIVSPPSFRA